jgi:hypothetical protein
VIERGYVPFPTVTGLICWGLNPTRPSCVLCRMLLLAMVVVVASLSACTGSSGGSAVPTPSAPAGTAPVAASPTTAHPTTAAKACQTLMTTPLYSAAAVEQAKQAAATDAYWAALVPAFEDLHRQSQGFAGIGGPALLTADRLCREVGVPVRQIPRG